MSAVDRRLRNHTYNVADESGKAYSWEAAAVGILMDIREELQKLNNRLSCYETLQIPSLLRSIKKNTTKPRKKKRKL